MFCVIALLPKIRMECADGFSVSQFRARSLFLYCCMLPGLWSRSNAGVDACFINFVYLPPSRRLMVGSQLELLLVSRSLGCERLVIRVPPISPILSLRDDCGGVKDWYRASPYWLARNWYCGRTSPKYHTVSEYHIVLRVPLSKGYYSRRCGVLRGLARVLFIRLPQKASLWSN